MTLSAGRATIDRIDHEGTIGTGQLINGLIDGALEDTSITDTVAGIGVSASRDLGTWFVEGEVIWRYRTDWDIAAPTPSINTVTNVFSNVGTWSALVNAGRHGTLGNHWRWQAGAGVGVALNDVDSEYIERAVPGVSGKRIFKASRNEVEPAWNVFASVRRRPRNCLGNRSALPLHRSGRFARRPVPDAQRRAIGTPPIARAAVRYPAAVLKSLQLIR